MTQLPLFLPDSKWKPPSLSTLPSWAGAARIGIDTETKDEHLRRLGCGVRRGGFIAGVSVAIEDGPKFYLPVRHDGGDNLPLDNVMAYLRDQAAAYEGEVCGAHLAYDLDYLWEAGITFPRVKGYRDTQVAEAVIWELYDNYSLEEVSKRWGYDGKFEEVLRAGAAVFGYTGKDVKPNIWRYPARYVGEYAEWDADLPLKVLRKQERRIEDDELQTCYDMENRLIPLLVRMRRRGVAIDEARLDKVERWLIAQEKERLAEIKRLTGYDIGFGNVYAAAKFQPALMAAGLDHATQNVELERMDHPVARHLVWARKVNKYRTSFAASVREHLVKGRIHCTFHQMRKTDDERDKEQGAKYGRLSCSDPNLQQQPSGSRAKTDEEMVAAAMWRSIYVPDEGKLWGSFDLKQQEPKWSFHDAAIMKLPKAEAVCQMLRDNPRMDTYEPIVEVAKVPRRQAKIIWLARAYGKGDGGLCEDLNLPTERMVYDRDAFRALYVATERGAFLVSKGARTWKGAGQEGRVIIERFDTDFPFLKMAAKIAKERANERGYVKLPSGRRCHFPQLENGTYDWTHKAFNRRIQGAAAEQTKLIVLALEDAGYELQLQVHDEVDKSIKDQQEAEAIAEVMRTTVPMRVPTVVDIEIGTSWGESMKVKIDGKEQPYRWSLG